MPEVTSLPAFAHPQAARLRVAALGLLLALTSCVAPPSYLAQDAPPAREVRSVLLVPMNFDTTPPTQSMARGVELVQADLVQYLESLGLEVVTPRLIDVLRAWHRASKQAGLSEADPPEVLEQKVGEAHAGLARALAESHPADIVLMPTLLVREGSYIGLELRWDGVTRAVPVRQLSGFTAVHRIAGKGMGTSLHVVLRRADGERFFDRYVGLEPLWRYTMSGDGHKQQITGFERTDLFEDGEIIRETVELAFEPYLPAEEAAN